MQSSHGTDHDGGFTLIEILVTLLLFAMVTTAFYQVLFSGTRGSRTARAVVRVSDEARLGLNRMIRDTRQAVSIRAATPTGYAVEVDFNGDEVIAQAPATNAAGDYEQLTFIVADGNLYIEVCSLAQGLDCGFQKTVLIEGVSPLGTDPYFAYSSNRLDYDCNNDGEATQAEISTSTCSITALTSAQVLAALTDIDYAFTVAVDDSSEEFRAHAEMRNLR